MRVLLDEQIPRKFAHELTGHDVRTVQQQGWAGVKNGDLIGRAEAAGFDIFITADQNLEFQLDVAQFRIRIIVLRPRSIRIEDLRPLVPELLLALQSRPVGRIIRIP